MQKVTVFIGPSRSGKSKLAHEIVSKQVAETAIRVHGKNFRKEYPFSECSQSTSLIVIDDIPNPSIIWSFVDTASNGITVHRKNETPFTIYPKIILIFSGGLLKEHFTEKGKYFIEKMLSENKDLEISFHAGTGMKDFYERFDVFEFPVSHEIYINLSRLKSLMD